MNDQTPPTELICVDPAMIRQVWPMVENMIDEGYAAVDEPTPDVLEWLEDKKGLLWLAVRNGRIISVLTTSLVQKRSGLACRLVTSTGDGGECLRHLGAIERYAKAEGCVKVCAAGRPGWARVLPGYRTIVVTLEKRL